MDCKLSISRYSGKDVFRIDLERADGTILFIGEMSSADFANCVGGLSAQKVHIVFADGKVVDDE